MTQLTLDGAPSDRLRPFFSYYGSKWSTIRALYPRPNHARIVEPFAGAATYALHYPDRDVILYDLDEHVTDVWRYLIGASASDILALLDRCDIWDCPNQATWALIGEAGDFFYCDDHYEASGRPQHFRPLTEGAQHSRWAE